MAAEFCAPAATRVGERSRRAAERRGMRPSCDADRPRVPTYRQACAARHRAWGSCALLVVTRTGPEVVSLAEVANLRHET